MLLCVAAVLPSRAAAISETFASAPTQRGWRTFGDASLFHWNATNENLEVTWDSSRTNSLFYRPLGTVLTKGDDFSIGFDLRLNDIAIGVNPQKEYTFQIAIGLCRFTDITNANFFRGASASPTLGPRNLVEFNYFPAFLEFAPTIAQVVVSTNRQWFYNHDNLQEMPPGDPFQVTMELIQKRLTTTVRRNGKVYGPSQVIDLRSATNDFRVDTFAVISYSDANQSPPQFSGSILAHGVIDNVGLVFPDPPLIALRGAPDGNTFRADFAAVTNWWYRLEVTRNFQQWLFVTEGSASTNGPFYLRDPDRSPDPTFYRVIANRP
jgi:hypothetical protein